MRKIDADVLIAYLQTHTIGTKENLLRIINEQPSIPGTCKTCINYDVSRGGWCKSWLGHVSEYDYCSFGRPVDG